MIIKEKQNQILTEKLQRNFEDKMVVRLRTIFPDESEGWAEADLRDLIRNGIERAFTYNIEIEADVARFIEYQFCYGEYFDQNEKLDWFQIPLKAEHLTGTEKMDIVDRLNYIALTSSD